MRSLKVLHCAWPVAEMLMLSGEEDLPAELQKRGVDDTDAIIEAAHEADILITKERLKELDKFFGPWTWGPAAASFLFGYQTDVFVNPEDELRITRKRKSIQPLLPDDAPVIKLPLANKNQLTDVIAGRRSRRKFADRSVETEPIAACLQAALGITGELKLENGRTLPLTGAPSPGGLNTYDGFLLTQNVTGLEAGTYCYLPQHHALTRQKGSAIPFDRLFGGQAWCAKAACVIVLVADLNRQASRYAFPTTLSAALIEAGTRVELILLQAEAASLSATVVGMTGVGAFDQQLAAQAGLPSETSMRIPLCAVIIGARD